MPRKPRQWSTAGAYHFINRGVNKRNIFHNDDDFTFYLNLAKEYADKLSIAIYHYCVMSNHSHFLLRADDLALISRFGYFLQRRYAYYYCKTYRWPEQVFRRRFLSLPIEDDTYLLECGRYIERNPLAAHLVDQPEDYPYSSVNHYAGGKVDALITDSPAYLAMSESVEERKTLYRFYLKVDRVEYKLPSSRVTQKPTCPF